MLDNSRDHASKPPVVIFLYEKTKKLNHFEVQNGNEEIYRQGQTFFYPSIIRKKRGLHYKWLFTNTRQLLDQFDC